MTKISIHGLNFYYELIGKGKPIVLIAGFTSDSTIWKIIAKQLSKHFQVLIFDNRGVGQTDCPPGPYTIDQMAQDTIDLIHALKLKKPHIIGHSMGGAIAQSIAYHHPEKIDKLILANSLIQFHPISYFAHETILEMRKKEIELSLIVKATIPWLFSNDYIARKRNTDAIVKMHLTNPYPMTNVGFLAQFQALKAFNSEKWLNKILAPTLVIGSDSDMLCPKDSYELAREIPNAEFYLFEHMGHLPLVEKPTKFIQTVLGFL